MQLGRILRGLWERLGPCICILERLWVRTAFPCRNRPRSTCGFVFQTLYLRCDLFLQDLLLELLLLIALFLLGGEFWTRCALCLCMARRSRFSPKRQRRPLEFAVVKILMALSRSLSTGGRS